jgi:hypothetical protein
MSIEENKMVARHFIEEMINGNQLDLADGLFAPS